MLRKPEQIIERWENVIRVLRNLTPHQRKYHFDMTTFGRKTDCGTVACAAGHCSLDPWFRRRGFLANFTKSGMLEPSRDDVGWAEMIENFFVGDCGDDEDQEVETLQLMVDIFYTIDSSPGEVARIIQRNLNDYKKRFGK